MLNLRSSQDDSSRTELRSLLAVVEQVVADTYDAAAQKDVLVGISSWPAGLETLCVTSRTASAITDLLLHAIARSPVRGVVTIDAEPSAQGVMLIVIDQGTAPMTDRGSFKLIWREPYGVAHGLLIVTSDGHGKAAL